MDRLAEGTPERQAKEPLSKACGRRLGERAMRDFHIHSRHSDGELAPSDLVMLARERGLSGMAITDHDTIDGVEEAVAVGRREGMPVAAGVELSVDGGIHLLGYGFDPGSPAVLDLIAWSQERRDRRNRRMMQRIHTLGYHVSPDEVGHEAGGRTIGRVHMALVLIRKGYFTSVHDVFDQLIAAGRPGYVARERMQPEAAIDAIHRGGGYAVWAHPLMRFPVEEVFERVNALSERGLDGVEAYYPGHVPDESAVLAEHCRRGGLFVTAGSDYHGPHVKPDVDLGLGWNGEPLPDVDVPFMP